MAIFHCRHRYCTVYSQYFFLYLSSVLQRDFRWQVLCAVWFGFTDVHFSLSWSFLCSSNSHVSLPPHSLPLRLPPCWYGENQWVLYSVEGLMSANEILSAMSHPSDSCWDNDKPRDQLFSIFYDLTCTNMATFMGTFIHANPKCVVRGSKHW